MSSRRARRPRSLLPEGADTGVVSVINVTPMVDVMLVLMIIFMVVTPMLTSGFQAELPISPGIETDAPESRVVLGIDHLGAFFIDGTPVANGDLAAALGAIYGARRSDRILYLQADRRLRYQRVLDAVGIARQAGVRVVAAVVEDRGSAPAPRDGR